MCYFCWIMVTCRKILDYYELVSGELMCEIMTMNIKILVALALFIYK